MAAPQDRKVLYFQENKYRFLKIFSVGYDDFCNCKTGDFFTINRWNALYYVRKGGGRFTIRGKTYEAKHGDLFFIPPKEPVMYYPDGSGAWEYYWIALYPDHAVEISEILGFCEDEPVRAAKSPKKIEWIFDSLMEAESATPEVYFMALSSLMQILSYEFSKSGIANSSKRHKELAESAKQIIELNFAHSDFSINDAAQMLYVSHAQMSRVFKESLGVTPVAYLIDTRLNRAAELLRERTLSVKELCAAVGFSDEWHFMKQFKKKFGITIKEYRKQHGAE